jgi:hypothetical protein
MAQHDPDHEKLVLLDRLEELLEDMEELGVLTIEEVRARIEQLDAELEDMSLMGDDGSV